jgi:hypothetical protein
MLLNKTWRPLSGSAFSCLAHATCREPAPWQPSQATLISDQVVRYRLPAAS